MAHIADLIVEEMKVLIEVVAVVGVLVEKEESVVWVEKEVPAVLAGIAVVENRVFAAEAKRAVLEE